MGGTLRHVRERLEQARALRDCCIDCFPRAVRPLVPFLDWMAQRWLMRSRSPYLGEVKAIADEVKVPGVWLLNGSYQWGCTTLGREEAGVPWLARTLDWPFPGLGRHAEVIHMNGPAGDFFSVAWPGFVGVLTGMAPGRFGVAINQAPLWRRTRHPFLRVVDIAANAIRTWTRVRDIPPDHLVRETLETCADYAAARAKLEQTPIARPVIFTLVGCKPGELCVIERTETGFLTREQDTCAANDWLDERPGWEARIAGDVLFSFSFEEAAANSRARRTALASWTGSLAQESLDWVAPPVLNPLTRIAIVMCPALGRLRATGYEVVTRGELPVPVTATCSIDTLVRAA